MTMMYNINEPQVTAEYKDMDMIYKWWNPANTTARGMLPIKLGNPNQLSINKYTLECATPTVYADRLFGIEDSILPVFEPTYTIMTDLLFSSFEYIRRNEFSLAKSFIQGVYLFGMTFADNNVKRTKSPVVSLTPMEL